MKKAFILYFLPGCLLSLAVPCVVYLLANIPLGGFRLVPGILVPIALGWLWAARSALPATLFARFLPLLLPPLCLLLAYVPRALSGDPIAPGLFTGIILMMLSGIYVCFWLGFLIGSERRSRSLTRLRGAACLLGLCMTCLGMTAGAHLVGMRNVLPNNYDEASVGHGVDLWPYQPFRKDNKLARPASDPSLRIRGDYPRLDGAVAAFPVYAAFAQAVYDGLDEKKADKYVTCTNTPQAYRRLTDGTADIFFGAAPSSAQIEYAASKGINLTSTPIGREAFVFFVHKDNPVRSLTREQIRAVYSGRITNWKQLGGEDERILAFQRPEDSGSQTTMLRAVMQGEVMTRPLREERSEGMGDIVIGVAAYRNRNNALGYSFRWYATALFPNPDIRLLAVDGVEPTPDNIRNGSYPFTVPLLAVTARPLGNEGARLMEWILGPEGQELLERVGYVSLGSVNE